MEGFLLQSRSKLEINITPDEEQPTYARLDAGITDFEPDPDE